MRQFLAVLLLFGFLFSQDKKEQLQSQIKEMQEKLEKERKFLDDYENRRQKLNASKQDEMVRLQADLKKTRSETADMNSKIRQNEIILKNYDLQKSEILSRFKTFALTMKNSVLTGMPYDEQRRAAILTSIISDIDSGVGTTTEILNRLVSFFDQDDALSYDSQTYSSIVNIGGKEVNVVALRIGRVLFFVDDGKNVYPYVNLGKGYVVDEKNPLDLSRRQAVRDAVSMLNSQKPLDILNLQMILGGSPVQTNTKENATKSSHESPQKPLVQKIESKKAVKQNEKKKTPPVISNESSGVEPPEPKKEENHTEVPGKEEVKS